MNELDEQFEQFWNAGMRKVNKKKAKALFIKIIKSQDDVVSFKWMLTCDIQKRLGLYQYGFSAMHPTTYLNGERWEDDYPEDNTHKQSNQTHSQRQHEQARHALREMESADAGFSTSIIRQIQ